MEESTDRSRGGGFAHSARRRKYRILPAVRPTLPAGPRAERSGDAIAREHYGRSREELIAEAAYYRAAARGFGPGDPDRDWLEAEAEIDAMLRERP